VDGLTGQLAVVLSPVTPEGMLMELYHSLLAQVHLKILVRALEGYDTCNTYNENSP